MESRTRHLESLPRLCVTFQRPYATVKRALDESGATPEMTLNGVPYYAEAAVERAAVRLQAGRVEKRSKR